MAPGRDPAGTVELVEGGGGVNAELANAEHEGRPRNGVLTGVEDFVAGHDRPLRLVVLPIYFGLAILVEEALLAERPRLAAVLDRLEAPAGRTCSSASARRSGSTPQTSTR